MRRIELLIKISRRETENEDFTETTGIDDTEFIRYFNDAQQDLQDEIVKFHQNVFLAEETQDVVAQQAEYPIPQDAYLDNRINEVWYSSTGQARDRIRLAPGSMPERIFDTTNNPAMYIRSTGKVIINPIPTSGVSNGLFFLYVKQLPSLDIRRAQIDTVTTSGNTITSLFLDTGVQIDRTELLDAGYFCVVGRDGDQKMRRVPIEDIDENTGEVTLLSGFEFEDGETISSGDYLVRGFDSANRSELPDLAERYLIAYCNWKIMRRDSSEDSVSMSNELTNMRSNIVGTYRRVDDNTRDVTITDTQFFDDFDILID